MASRVSNALWAQIGRLVGMHLNSPANKSMFEVAAVSSDNLTVLTRNTKVVVRREAFEQTLEYLIAHKHIGKANQVIIGASSKPEKCSDLCMAARVDNKGKPGPRVITYVLPILEACGLAQIGRNDRPSTTWVRQ